MEISNFVRDLLYGGGSSLYPLVKPRYCTWKLFFDMA